MKILNDHGLKLAVLTGRVPPRPLTATFIVKAGFSLRAGGTARLLPADQQPEFSGDQFAGDDPARGLRYPSDFAIYKPGADLLLGGQCHAPAGHMFRHAEVVFAVGDVAKRLMVFGDRMWMPGAVTAAMSDPVPFRSMPLTWDRSFGGSRDPRNPAGRGLGETKLADGTMVRLLPNVESRHSLVSSPFDRPTPAGFGPISPSSPERAARTGTYDDRWLEQHWPWLPDDFDWTFFNAAPSDQQLPRRFLRGDEPLRFDHMHPDHAGYQCRLAGDRVRLFVRRRRGMDLLFEQVEMRLDTLFADLDSETVTLVWRGVAPADSMKLKEFEEAFVVLEGLTRPLAADLDGYERLYATRKEEIAAMESTELSPIDPIAVTPPRLPDTAWADRLRAQVAELPALLAGDSDDPLDIEWRELMGAGRPAGRIPPAPVVNTLAEGEALIRSELAKLQAADPGFARAFSDAPLDFASLEAEFGGAEHGTAPDVGAAAEPARDQPRAGWTRQRVQQRAADGGAFDGEDLAGLDLSDLDFSGLSFREAVFDDARLVGCTFDRSDLARASLTRATLTAATFLGADLSGADLAHAVAPASQWGGANLANADFEGTNLSGASFAGCTGKHAGFSLCDLNKASFEGCVLTQPDFASAALAGANFTRAVLPDAAFYKAVAPSANFAGAQMLRGRFNDAQVAGANFTGCRLDDGVFENARLSGAIFTDAQLSRAIFTGAQIADALFLRAHCVNAKFDDVAAPRMRVVQTNLFRATFENADLSGAAFLGSNCYEVEFFQAIVRKATFDRTNLKGTKLA
jgi:uncharacterized protein YjbI with pentapeptide repeats